MQAKMKVASLIIIFIGMTASLILSSHAALPDKLQPFTSDGCSAFPDGTLFQQTLWQQCCTTHDKAYWQGGTYQQRLDADLALEACVAKVGEPDIAKLMLAGVRVGGSPYWPTSFRWGYGWKYPRAYRATTTKQSTSIDTLSAEEAKPQLPAN
ncbi:MAG: hypothetical protein ACRBEE_03390 [Arenicella sp.]